MERRPEICQYCRRPVIWASVADRKRTKPIAIEVCQPGVGNMALVPGLFGDAPLAELVGNGTRYRSHREHCPRRPSPAQAFSRIEDRKQRPSSKG